MKYFVQHFTDFQNPSELFRIPRPPQKTSIVSQHFTDFQNPSELFRIPRPPQKTSIVHNISPIFKTHQNFLEFLDLLKKHQLFTTFLLLKFYRIYNCSIIFYCILIFIISLHIKCSLYTTTTASIFRGFGNTRNIATRILG
jgi:hypothetical protein